MTTFSSVCRCLLLTCAYCRAEGSTWVYAGSSLWVKDRFIHVLFMIGWCYTLSRDVAEALVSYEPLRRLAYLPYSKEREEEFFSIHMQHEDVMVGRVLVNELNYKPMVYVEMQGCHFHDARNGTGHSQVVPTSMCVHHVREDDYAALMARFRQRHIACCPCATCLRRHDIPVVRLTNGRNDLFSVYVEF
ncbi:putative UDP-Gal or UDP-GlcNAc-dependent glycosyltransferase [Trypanosoma cruzi]|uniref:Putative UDP-Gal or UDP-GlcNAc-dependent glycosyltransferase n=1 Tax=Trypanosoma cruzi TaxID=5693 RepID=A0A2V2UVZ9_TRYCR|nr:putative UDP-Gal or UDP-GlcNAc-dependent glycosyltransferase [Trypanosoma cruzi]